MIARRPKSLKHAYRKILRHPGTPEAVARGVAIGFFTAFVIPFSFQMIIAFMLAVPLRAARFVALLCTWVSNPLSIVFIYPVQCYVGSYLIRRPLSYDTVRTLLSDLWNTPSLETFSALSSEVLISFLVGGFLFGLVSAVAGYYTTIPLVKRHHERKGRRQQQRLAQQMEPETNT